LRGQAIHKAPSAVIVLDSDVLRWTNDAASLKKAMTIFTGTLARRRET
jgi:hypothetical protein